MATKIGLTLLQKSLEENNHTITDVVIRLAHMSMEDSSSELFIVPVEKPYINFLATKLKEQLPNVTTRTLNTILKKLSDNEYIYYSDSKSAWVLNNMEQDFKKGGNGFIYLRDVFFTDEFSLLKVIEKRLMLYFTQLIDSKASIKYKDIKINLLRKNSAWLQAMQITNIPYAIYIIKRFLNNHKHWFTNITMGITTFQFKPICLDRQIKDNNNDIELVKVLHSKESNLLKESIAEKNMNYNNQLEVSEIEQMHIIRAICNTSSDIQQAVIDNILNKLISDRIYTGIDTIKSFAKYVAGITQRIIKEKIALRKHLKEIHYSSI